MEHLIGSLVAEAEVCAHVRGCEGVGKVVTGRMLAFVLARVMVPMNLGAIAKVPGLNA